MFGKLKIAIAATLIAAATAPFFTAASNAAPSGASQSYWHRHDTKGW